MYYETEGTKSVVVVGDVTSLYTGWECNNVTSCKITASGHAMGFSTKTNLNFFVPNTWSVLYENSPTGTDFKTIVIDCYVEGASEPV